MKNEYAEILTELCNNERYYVLNTFIGELRLNRIIPDNTLEEINKQDSLPEKRLAVLNCLKKQEDSVLGDIEEIFERNQWTDGLQHIQLRRKEVDNLITSNVKPFLIAVNADGGLELQEDLPRIDVPFDGSCLFWAVALAYLLPIRNNEQKFSTRYKNIFGDDQVLKEDEVRKFLLHYNPLLHDYPDNDSLKELVTNVFRNRVMDYVSSKRERLLGHIDNENDQEEHIQHMRIPNLDTQSWADEPEIHAVMEKFNINLNIFGRYLDRSNVGMGIDGNNNVERVSISLSYVNNNYYNYCLDQDTVRAYRDQLLKDSYKTLQNHYKKDLVSFSEDSDEVGEVPLTKKDIINIAEIEYEWNIRDRSKVIFDVVDADEFLRKDVNQLLNELKLTGKPSVYIVDPGSSHWVTLGIVYRHERFFAYYIDPLGNEIPDKLKKYLLRENIYCPSIKGDVKHADFNTLNVYTGILALKNAKIIHELQVLSLAEQINKALNEATPPKALESLRKELYKKDSKYKKLDSKNLNNELDSLCLQLKKNKVKNEFTFIISPPSGSNDWATLTVGFRDEQIVACYVASHSTDTTSIEDLLSKKRIVIIFARDTIESVLLSKFSNNVELLILQSAKVVTNYFRKKKDYIALAKDGLSYNFSKKDIDRLAAIKKIVDKIRTCEKVITEYSGRYIKQLKEGEQPKDITQTESNILILFQESTALYTDFSHSLSKTVISSRNRIIGNENFKIIDQIRSEHLVHRSKSNTNVIIRPKDLKKFTADGITRTEFFKKLEKYLGQVIGKLDGETIDSTQEIKVDSFFKTEDEIKEISYQAEDERGIKQWLDCKFKHLVSTKGYASENMQESMFELIINIFPLLENLDLLKIKELSDIKTKRNDLIHNFHKYSSEAVRKFELKKFLDTLKPTFFKYIYSQKVYNILSGVIPSLSADKLKLKLERSLSDFLNKGADIDYVAVEIGGQDKVVNFRSIASKLIPSVPSKDVLRDFINNYIKLMYVIDNEDSIKEREKKYASLPKRYNQLSGYERQYIYEYLSLLKELNGKKNLLHEYKLIKEQFAKELRKEYGILKSSFDAIISSYVEGNNEIDGNQLTKIENKIYSDIDVLSKIIKKRGELTISKIIEYYRDRKKLRAEEKGIEEKFKSIPEGEIITIERANISTDRFVVNILELFDSVNSKYIIVFKKAEEAFSDETFLNFLTHNEVSFTKEVLSKLLNIEYISPYIVEMITKENLISNNGLIAKGLITNEQLLGIIENLLTNKLYAVHLKKLLEISNEKLLKVQSSDNPDISSELYRQVCDRINVNNIHNLYQLLKDETHAREILNKLSEIIIDGNNKNHLIKSILDLLDSISEELYNKKDYKKLHTILSAKGVNDLVNKLLGIDTSDLGALKIRRRIAIIKNEKDTKDDTAQRILQEIMDKIEYDGREDRQSFFLLVLSDTAYTKHLKGKHKEAYNKYEALYEKMVKLSLRCLPADWNEFYGTYTYKVINSQKYERILKYHQKYLDILKVRSDMAYERRCQAYEKEKSSSDEALQYYEEALTIYDEVYHIKVDKQKGTVGVMRDIAFIKNKIGYLKLQSNKEEDLQLALSSYVKALGFYQKICKIQEVVEWATHPAVLRIEQKIEQAIRSVACTNNKLAHALLKASNNKEEALQHFEEAFKIYDEVYEIQKKTLGENHNKTRKTKEYRYKTKTWMNKVKSF